MAMTQIDSRFDTLSARRAVQRAPQQQIMVRAASATRVAAEQSRPDVLAMFAAQVARAPQRTAVRCGDASLSYAELDARSNQLAHLLIQVGVAADVLVGIYLGRSLDLMVAILAVLKSGGAYLPLDPCNPPQRIRAILDVARPRVVIESVASPLSEARGETMHICLDRDRDCIAAFPKRELETELSPEQLAYVIFTSGSTGQPKGVQICQRGLTNYLHAMAREPGLDAADNCLALATISFDMSVFDFLLPPCLGACTIVADEGLGRDVERLKERLEAGDITFLHATPTSLRMLLDAGWQGDARVRVLSGGEALTRELAGAVLGRVAALYNGYGPTETTVCATMWKVAPDAPISIGSPIDNTRVYVLDMDRKPVPTGSEGELWIAGEGLARGYLGRPELTTERFVVDPFDSRPGQRMYRTGDLVRRDEHGQLFFIGRADDQVKLRGFRIELGEIETVLEAVPELNAAVVKLHRDARTGSERLAAFFTSAAELDPLALRAHALAQLPAYMVPSSFDRIAELPRTPSGKLDRRALPEPAPLAREGRAGEALDSDMERVVAAAFSEVFDLAQVAADDDFFALGGTSLLALRFKAALEARTAQPFALKHLFEGRNVRAIAGALEHSAPAGGATVLALQPHGTRAPVFCLLGIYHYQALAEAMKDVDRPWYGVYVPAEAALFGQADAGTASAETLRSLAGQYVDAIRKRQPHGPYCLLGHSTGGVLAYEAALQLTEAGEQVEQLVILDSVLSGAVRRSAKQHVRHVLRRARRAWQRVALRAKRALLSRQPESAELRQQLDKTQQALRELTSTRAYEVVEAAWERCQARPYAGVATFVHAMGRTEPCGEVEPTAGWGALVRGGLRVLEMPGAHADMVRQPNVALLAHLLRPVLGASQSCADISMVRRLAAPSGLRSACSSHV
jgi:amino acid adenylation domain-containing protein